MTLERCPFCNGEAVFNTTDVEMCEWSALISFTLACSACGAKAGHSNGHISITLNQDGSLDIWKDQQNISVVAWNQRV